MNFILNREQLIGPLQQIVRVIGNGQRMPILSNLLLQCHDNRLVISGTDLEVQIVSRLNLDNMRTGGSITLPAKKLLDICRLLPTDSSIKFDIDHGTEKVKISSGRGRYSLNTMPADCFPEFQSHIAMETFKVKAGTLKQAIDKTAFCMGSDDVRIYLNGIELSINGSKLKLVASDGCRLSMYEDNAIDADSNVTFIIPRKAVQELGRLLGEPENDVVIRASKNSVEFLYENVHFYSKLVDAKYPNFSRCYNQDFLPPIRIDRISLKEALMRVKVLANEKSKGITFDIKDGLLTLSSNNPDCDEAEEIIEIDYDGNSVNISFNAQYMLDAVSNIDSDAVNISVAANASACFLDDPGNSQFKFIVMPMRL